ncbi:MAG TPA: OmpA family protein [Quisquiliibacterium sp.]|nr:OmpA family protein [Quisquiliibacterium sp.]HQD83409.1 OmpA family protein [Quisquiliibacterium sp.]HQN10610.1 OmpA family protein [Quisquiliibacterium sp.]HQP67172.1 OmpA family protein [Quisquiliibacterium sp.]
MDDEQQNDQTGLVAWILGIAVTIAIVVSVVIGTLSALNAGGGTKAGTAAPAAAAAASGTAVLYFDTGKADLPADASALLAPLVQAAAGGKRLVVSGFHDTTGSAQANEELAKQRAFAVRDALKAAGVAEDRIELSKPQETSGGTEGRESRRVEVSAQ